MKSCGSEQANPILSGLVAGACFFCLIFLLIKLVPLLRFYVRNNAVSPSARPLLSYNVCLFMHQGMRTCKVMTARSRSQSYFTTGGLPPVSSAWRQAP
jgi:hypothetical protein